MRLVSCSLFYMNGQSFLVVLAIVNERRSTLLLLIFLFRGTPQKMCMHVHRVLVKERVV